MNYIDKINDLTEYFISKGYHKYNPTPFDSDHTVSRFQKRFDDDQGKRYFIDCVQYDNSYMPQHYKDGEWYTKYTYEYEIQMYQRDTHNPINLSFFSGWELEQVEEFMEMQWKIGLYDYYERWDEC